MPQPDSIFSLRKGRDLFGVFSKALQLLARLFSRLSEVAPAPRIVATEVLHDNRVVYRSPRGL